MEQHPVPAMPGPTPPKPGMSTGTKWLIGIGVVVVLAAIGGATGNDGSPSASADTSSFSDSDSSLDTDTGLFSDVEACRLAEEAIAEGSAGNAAESVDLFDEAWAAAEPGGTVEAAIDDIREYARDVLIGGFVEDGRAEELGADIGIACGLAGYTFS